MCVNMIYVGIKYIKMIEYQEPKLPSKGWHFCIYCMYFLWWCWNFSEDDFAKQRSKDQTSTNAGENNKTFGYISEV